MLDLGPHGASWGATLASVALLVLACQGGDIRGTYDVQIVIEGARAPIDGTLVLSSTALDVEGEGADLLVPSLEDPPSDIPDYGDATAVANSCLAFASNDPRDDRPRGVTLFDVRLRGDRTLRPFAILAGDDYTLAVERLRFFANAIGGDVLLKDANGDRQGRIVGDRVGESGGQRCYDEISRYRERVRDEARAIQAG